MAPMDRCLASAARLSLSHIARPSATSIPRFLAPILVPCRRATAAQANKTKPKRPISKDYKRNSLEKSEFPRFSLCAAMRVLRASEVGQPPAVVKYELHIVLKTARNGPVIKSSIRLPYPVQSDWQIAVICPEGSKAAIEATAAGAVAVGEEAIFEAVRQEKINFDRLICHDSSEKALMRAGLGKILGPKGLMPNKKMKTIVSDVAKSIKDSAGAADYRERQGIIHMAIGQLGFNPEQLKANIQALMKKIKLECAELSEESPKEVHDIVLSTTNGPALSLNAKVREEGEVSVEDMSGAM